MPSTTDVERQLAGAGYLPSGVDLRPRPPTAGLGVEGIIRGAAGRYGLNPDDAVAVARLESGLNPRAQNPNSSAGGLFQFIDSTWNQYGGGDKYDAARNSDAGVRYLRDVRDTMARGLGRTPTIGELYLGHQQGASGALRILQNPDGLAREAVGPDAVVLNGGDIDMTNRDFAARWGRRAARAAGQAPSMLEVGGAALRQQNSLASLFGYGMPFHGGLDDPTFNPIVEAEKDPVLRPYLSEFVDVRNRTDYARTAERIRMADDDRATLASAGWTGTVASVAAGLLDPINLIPIGGGAWRALKTAQIAQGVITGLVAGGGGAALQELVLQNTDPTRTAEEGALNIAASALGGAGLGVGGVLASGGASRLGRAGILGAGGAAGGAAGGLAESVYSGQDLEGSLATIGTSAVIGGLLGGSVGALARPGRTARDVLHDIARDVDIGTDVGNGAVYTDIRQQMLGAGRVEAEADAGGRLWQSHVDAMALATGMPQDEVYRLIRPEIRTGEVGLPMDEASRNARALAQGWSEETYYHGTRESFGEFRRTTIGTATDQGWFGEGFYFTRNPEAASGYADRHSAAEGANVLPVRLKMRNSLVIDPWSSDEAIAASEKRLAALGVDANLGNVTPAELTERAKAAGYDSIIVGDGDKNTEYVVFDPEQVRSRFAKFDPEKAGSADLLAQKGRGTVEFRDDVTRITLGAKADASTFLHESGHVFLRNLDLLSAQSPELAADLAKVREWMKNDGGEITREQQEQWARGFEAYLRDGKAPNSALREVFERFRDWLTAIYRSLADLDVELSDDVRGVMDRLIGVDDEDVPAVRGGSLSAASMPVASLDDLRIARGAEVPAKVVSRIPLVGGPDLVLGTSPIRAARWAMRKLMRPVLAVEGDLAGRPEVATENVESAAAQWHGVEVRAKQRAREAYTEYAKAAAAAGEPVLKRDDILNAASQAGRRGDSGAKLALGPAAQKAVGEMARIYREEVFDPLLQQALEQGLMTQAQVNKAKRLADSYIPRVWNIPKIIQKRTQFTNEIVMPQVVRDWEDARRKLAAMRQTTRFADEQLRQIVAAGIEHGGPEAAAAIIEGPQRTPAQVAKDNVKALEAALADPAVDWADGDEARARELTAKAGTPAIFRAGMEGVPKTGPALTAAEAQEVQDMLLRTHGLSPTDEADVGVRARRAVQAMRERVAALEEAAKTARDAKPLASMTKEQATEASRLMTEQAAKLTSDADAVRALADQYETALKKSLRERAKAYRTLDADDNIGHLDEADLPDVANDIVEALVGHTNNRLQYEGLKIQARGPLKEKTFNVRDEFVDGGNGGENWLENDIELLASRYVKTLAPDVELKRLTGDVNAEPLRRQIIQEYTDRANTMEDGPAKSRLDRRQKRDLAAFDGVVARLRGTYGLPRSDAQAWGLRASRLAKAFNITRLLGRVVISQFGDVGRIVFRSGMQRFVGDAVMPLISNWEAVKLTKRELQMADVATELVRSSMALRGAELFDDYAKTSWIEEAAQKAAAGVVRIAGLDYWNQGTKTISGMIAQHTLVDGVRKLASGAEMKPMEIADLSRVGIGAREAEFLLPFLNEFSRDVRGITIPNTPDWAGDRAGDAARLWRGALRQIVDDMVVNPGQDRALGLSRPLLSTLAQLETFNLVSTQRTILAGIQRRDAGVMIGSAAMIGLGMLSYYLKAKIAGWVFGSTSTWQLPDDPGEWLVQGVNASGLLGMIGSLDKRLSAATSGALGSEALMGSPTRSRYSSADITALFGPTGSAAGTAYTSAQAIGRGDWNWRDTHRLRTLVPLQNYWLLSGVFDQAEIGINDFFGVRQRPPTRQ